MLSYLFYYSVRHPCSTGSMGVSIMGEGYLMRGRCIEQVLMPFYLGFPCGQTRSGRGVQDLLRCTAACNTSLGKDGCPVREEEGFPDVVGHQQRGEGHFAVEIPDKILHGMAKIRIQTGKGLVQQQKPRLHRYCPGQGDPLLLAAGESMDHTFFCAAEAYSCQ